MSRSAPLIGVSALERDVRSSRGAFYPAHAVDANSVLAVSRAGGIPVLLPRLAPERAAAQLQPVEALVLSGGNDVDASLYGAETHPRSVDADPARDRWELALTAAARERGLAILGICRGAQLLNVSLGGTLHGHLDDSDRHELDVFDGEGRHAVTIETGSHLTTVLGRETLDVASSHHQGIDALGSGLVVSARAPDGVIEAVESEDGSEIGVQWHPEFQLEEHAGQPLFDWLVDRDGGLRSPLA